MQSRKTAFLKEFFFLAVPVMLQSLSGNILNICDTMMVGRISEIAISGVTVANKTYFIYTLVIYGASSGISIFMAQYCGSGKIKVCNGIFRFGMLMCVGIGAAFFVFLSAAPSAAVGLYVKAPETIAVSLSYIQVVRFSYIPAAVSAVCAVYLRIMQKAQIPMLTGFASMFMNVFLNYALIYGHLGFPAMGVTGAAIATLLSRCMEMAAVATAFWAVFRKSERGIERLTIETKWFMVQKIIPLICNETIWAVALTMVFRNYCRIHEDAIPAITVADNVFDLVNVAFAGCSTAAGVMMGKILGAGRLEEAGKASGRMIKINLTVTIGSSILVILTAPLIPGIFSLAGNSLLAASGLLRIRALFCWMYGYGETIYYILRAGGDTKAVLMVDGLCVVFGPLLVSTILVTFSGLSLEKVYFLTEASNILKVVIATCLLKQGAWLKNLTEGK